MKTIRSVGFATAVILVLSQAATYRAAGPEKRPIELADIMAWKGIDSPTLSEDGAWFGYRLTPAEGDGDVVFRQTKGEKHFQFSIGEQPEGAGARGGGGQRGQGEAAAASVAFSSDGKYAAFMAFPTRAEQEQLRRQRRPVEARAGIVNLETGNKSMCREFVGSSFPAKIRNGLPCKSFHLPTLRGRPMRRTQGMLARTVLAAPTCCFAN